MTSKLNIILYIIYVFFPLEKYLSLLTYQSFLRLTYNKLQFFKRNNQLMRSK